MIYLLYGPDTYRSRSVLRGIIEEFKNKAGGATSVVRRFDAEEESVLDVIDLYRTPSFFGVKTLVVVERFLSSDGNALAAISPLMKDWALSKDFTIVFWDADVDGSDPVLLAVKKYSTKAQEFKLLAGAKLSLWLEKELLRRNLTLAPKIKHLLLVSSEGNLWKLVNELSKLEAGSQILTEHNSSRAAKVWDFTDSFMVSSARSLTAAFRLIYSGEKELYLIGALAKTLRSLISFHKALEKNFDHLAVSKILGLHDFVAHKLHQAVGRVAGENIVNGYWQLLFADKNIKTGKLPASIAFLNLFVRN